jgi:UDP-2,3-diacylglucosamine pyrophosphatase LpxH
VPALKEDLKIEAAVQPYRDAADKAQREAASLRAKVAVLTRERARFVEQLGVIESLDRANVERPVWALPSKKKGSDNRATLCLLITDTHFDEVVDPDQIDGLNCYNREIAELRLRRCVEHAVMLARDYLGGVKYDGVTLFLRGDIFSGNIHEELARTNEDTLFGSLEHWLGPMEAAIGTLADEFKRIHVVGVPGNHGRMSRKPIAKQRAADNLDWLFYRWMARDFVRARDQRVTWDVPTSADAHVTVYSTRYLLTHGDQFRGGSGISGALAPLMLGSHRKTRRQAAAGKPYDYMVMGHWHQHLFLPSRALIVGPCLKGYDEWAFVSNFEPEPPQQALWITTPEHGITFSAPVFVQDRAGEGW